MTTTPQTEPTPSDTPPKEIVWLFTHCLALGMTKKSDSGKLEHDIALFVIDLEWESAKLREEKKAEREAFLLDIKVLQQSLDNERQKVAGCSTAAFGYWKEGDGLHPDYECAAIHDVAQLYGKYLAALGAEAKAGERAEKAEQQLAEVQSDLQHTAESLRIHHEELAALRSQLEKQEADIKLCCAANERYVQLHNELRSQLAEAQADARRWKHFRDEMDMTDALHMIANGTAHYDTACDTAIGATHER